MGHARREFLLVFTLSGADVKPSSHVPPVSSPGAGPGVTAGTETTGRSGRAKSGPGLRDWLCMSPPGEVPG